MSNKIDNTFGAGSAGDYNTDKKPREQTPPTKSFGQFLNVDGDDDYRSAHSSSGEGEEQSSGASLFDNVFRRPDTGRDDDYEPEQSRSEDSQTRRADDDSKAEGADKPDHKTQPKIKRGATGKEEVDVEKERKRLSELQQSAPLPAFQVPMQVDRASFVAPIEKSAPVFSSETADQIVQEVRLGVNSLGAAEFQFDLKSDVLEGLKLKISTKDGRVSASFVAENVHVKDAIDQGAQELIKALQSRGLEVAEIQVSIGADTGSGADRQDDGRQSYGQPDGGTVRGESAASASSADVEQSGNSRSSTDYTV